MSIRGAVQFLRKASIDRQRYPKVIVSPSALFSAMPCFCPHQVL